MSYSRKYSRTVSKSYSNTVSISYPASQNGGSVSRTVSGTVEIPIDIDIYVDTDSFDNNVNGCKRSVNALNAAVIATSAAEVEIKKQTSQQIGQTVIGGFFTLISAELSQQTKELASKCEALLMSLLECNKSCLDKKDQMQDDFSRIATRYAKLFADLDNELSMRIKTVDTLIFKTNNQILDCVSRTTNMPQLGVAAVAGNETLQLNSIISATMIKQRANKLISKTNEFLKGTYILQNSLKNLLSETTVVGDYLLPVIYLESKNENNSINHNVHKFNLDTFKNIDDTSINIELETHFQDKEKVEWCEIDDLQRQEIQTYLNNEFESAQLDSRLANMINNLISIDKISVIKKNN